MDNKGRCSVAEEGDFADANAKEDVEDKIQTEAVEEGVLETWNCSKEENWNMELVWKQVRHVFLKKVPWLTFRRGLGNQKLYSSFTLSHFFMFSQCQPLHNVEQFYSLLFNSI